jgi:hypothetical protein
MNTNHTTKQYPSDSGVRKATEGSDRYQDAGGESTTDVTSSDTQSNAAVPKEAVAKARSILGGFKGSFQLEALSRVSPRSRHGVRFNRTARNRPSGKDSGGGVTSQRSHGCDKITRTWAMASANTFDVPPIGGFVKRYLDRSDVSIDPFARNKRWATYTNDLNPNTAAECHMEAADFLRKLKADGVQADLVIFDPPYNASQAKECYESIGLKNTLKNAQSGGAWAEEKNIAAELLTEKGVFLWFGWNTCGMGKGREFKIAEILIVSHGRGKNDTLCMAETRAPQHPELFPAVADAPPTFGDAGR